MNLWALPVSARLGEREFPHASDFRAILKILSVLGDEARPAWFRWLTALAMFYDDPIPRELEGDAMAYLSSFLTCGDPGSPGPKLLDWQRDAAAIIADVNAVAGREVRAEAYLHWWSFLSFFHSIREGQLSTRVAIRDKLARGKKLEPWEQDYYNAHKDQIRLLSPLTPAEQEQKTRLQALLTP